MHLPKRNGGQRQREESTRVVDDSALHGKATVGANQEEHRGLARWPSVEGEGLNLKAWEWGNGGIDRHRDRYSHGGHSTVDYLSLIKFEQQAEFA
jgi:hypothetical protein